MDPGVSEGHRGSGSGRGGADFLEEAFRLEDTLFDGSIFDFFHRRTASMGGPRSLGGRTL
ncbi:hypothetical protein BR93DRAFT_333029 [Coniochaeta sp. PMI_546]|nr:hypothetical protein BR93DRAFT_333029 [Coniochaeta sp. PMI_546]